MYQLASITKTFGSIILMQLAEAGKVNLDDPIAKYGIDLGARWGNDERIKVKHLLTHSASGNSLIVLNLVIVFATTEIGIPARGR